MHNTRETTPEAVMDLFAQNGYAEIHICNITDNTQIKAPLIYDYFKKQIPPKAGKPWG